MSILGIDKLFIFDKDIVLSGLCIGNRSMYDIERRKIYLK